MSKMHPEVLKTARNKIGLYLSGIREFKGISRNEMVRRTGLSYQQIQRIEDGDMNYTIDLFLTYVTALDCYFYLAAKDGKEGEFDKEHLLNKAKDPI